MNMENKKIEIYYSDSISVIILDGYGRKIFKNFIYKSKENLDSINIRLFNKNEILDFLENFKSRYLCIIGDLQEKETKDLVGKIKKLDKFKMYLLLKNCEDIELNKNISICNIKDEREGYYFLESLLYLEMYSSLVGIDEADIWCMLCSSYLRRIQTNSSNLKKDIEKIESKNLFVHFIIGRKERLRDTNYILEKIQKELNNSNMVYMVRAHNKIKDNEIEINILYGEDEHGFERNERTSC